jgi:hypothetical protein
MLTSVGLISTLAASITASFLGRDEEEEFRELKQQISSEVFDLKPTSKGV